MRVVALVSGGKDSCYNMMQCVAEGHEIVALANLHSKEKDELDSYMYQTVGHQGITKLAEAMELPLYRRETKGYSTQRGKVYVPTECDEVEDLYDLLKCTKEELNIEAVASGAIFSDYQRVRVENVCSRLNLISLSYLWRRDQIELLQEMIDCKVHSIIIKVASLGLYPDRHLGKSLRDMQSHLLSMHEKYGLNVCGEGGEYESFTLDCPLFKKRIVVDDMQIVLSSSDPVCPVGYINFTKLRLVPKENIQKVNVKNSIDYISHLFDTFGGLNESGLSDNELELIKHESKLRTSISKDDLLMQEQEKRSHSFSQQNVSFSAESIYLMQDKDHEFYKSLDIFRNERIPIKNSGNAVVNSKGWMWITGIQGVGDNSRDSMISAIEKLQELIKENNFEMTEICYITLYIKHISDYPDINAVYSKYISHQNPPTRVCVECPLPDNCFSILEAVAHHNNNSSSLTPNENGEFKRHTMHVQGISHWAPANIGPYSQATRLGDIIYISGQIALIPGSMTLIDGGIKQQCKLTLRHLTRIADAMNISGQLRKVVQGICYLTNPSYISEARKQWEKRTANAIMDYIVVPALPRNALVEWQVWAHNHNDIFDYEETGCSVDEYTISIRRRWNFENNVAAIVCYVSTSTAISRGQLTELKSDVISHHRELAKNITADNIIYILTYTLNKLLKDYSIKYKNAAQGDDSCSSNESANSTTTTSKVILPAIHLRIFYQVTSNVPVDLLGNTLHEFCMKSANVANLAFTLIPACSLHNFNTFLSICGLRYE